MAKPRTQPNLLDELLTAAQRQRQHQRPQMMIAFAEIGH